MLTAFLLTLTWTFFWEQAAIKIKKINKLHQYQKWLLILFFEFIISATILIFFIKWTYFKISTLSILLEIILIILIIEFFYFVIKVIEESDRSTATIFSSLVIPLLLITDIILWYNITYYQILWVIFISTILLYNSFSWVINTKWIKYILITNLISLVSISIYKYLITNYTNAYTQLNIQSLFGSILLSLLIIKNYWLKWIKKLLNKNYLLIGLLRGSGTTITWIAYMFWPASIVTVFKRISTMFWWTIFWKIIFEENNFKQKLVSIAFISIWIIIINIPQYNNIFNNNSFIKTDIISKKLKKHK